MRNLRKGTGLKQCTEEERGQDRAAAESITELAMAPCAPEHLQLQTFPPKPGKVS